MIHTKKWPSKLSAFLYIFNSKSVLLLGVVMILSSATVPGSFLGGIFVIFGTLAYRSAKNRALGITKPSSLKQVLEILSLVVIIATVILVRIPKTVLVDDPFPYVGIPTWILTAYLTVVFSEFFSGGRWAHIGKVIAVYVGIFLALSFLFFFLDSILL